jgi:lysophospholipase L1-like esterase
MATRTLAHPLDAAYAALLGLEARDWRVGEVITVDDRIVGSLDAAGIVNPVGSEGATTPTLASEIGNYVAEHIVHARRPTGMQPWYAALANRHLASCKIAVVGDSVSEGQGATLTTNRWIERLQTQLRTAFPVAGVTGGIGHLPTYYASGTIGQPATINLTGQSGTATAVNDEAFGLGGRSKRLSRSAWISWTGTCTSFKVHYGKGPFGVAFNVSVDGGANTLVNTNDPVLSGGFVYTSGALSAASHTVRCTTVDTTGFFSVVSGIEFFNGDETKGIRVLDCSRSGASAFMPAFGVEHFKSLAQVAPQLVIVPIATNDAVYGTNGATFKTNLQLMVTRIRAALTYPHTLILVTVPQPNLTLQDNWQAYIEAQQEIAETNTNCLQYDLGPRMPAPASDLTPPAWADAAHPSDLGNGMIADAMFSLITP